MRISATRTGGIRVTFRPQELRDLLFAAGDFLGGITLAELRDGWFGDHPDTADRLFENYERLMVAVGNPSSIRRRSDATPFNNTGTAPRDRAEKG